VSDKPFSGRCIFGFSWTLENETDLFRKFLCAMYNRPYRDENIDELSNLTQLADFYCVLPIVSATLTAALLGSPMFKFKVAKADENGHVPFNAVAPSLIFEARKLRYSVLFRECLIHCVARWAEILNDSVDTSKVPASSRGQEITSDPILTSLVNDKYIKLCRSVMSVSQSIMLYTATTETGWVPPEFIPLKFPEQNAEYYVLVQKDLSESMASPSDDDADDLKARVDALLENNLVLDQSGLKPGRGIYRYELLSSNIADEDMPWDATETDW